MHQDAAPTLLEQGSSFLRGAAQVDCLFRLKTPKSFVTLGVSFILLSLVSGEQYVHNQHQTKANQQRVRYTTVAVMVRFGYHFIADDV